MNNNNNNNNNMIVDEEMNGNGMPSGSVNNNNNNNNNMKVLKYNEIPLKSFSDNNSNNNNNWKEFTIETTSSSSSSSSYGAVDNQEYIESILNKFKSTPYRSGGYNYKKSSNLTDGRFIIWRLTSNSSILELSEFYSHNSLEGNQIKIHLNNSNIIGDVFIQELNNDYVIIMFTTINKTIHRLLLPHPTIIENNDSRVGIKRNYDNNINSNSGSSGNINSGGSGRNYKSIFSNLLNSNLDNQWSKVKSGLPDSFEPTVIRYYSATKLIMGSVCSGSTWLELSEPKQNGDISIKRFDCKEGQGFFSSWKWNDKQDLVQDIQFFNDANNNSGSSFPLAFILLNNSQLKVWSANEKKFIKEFTILPQSWGENNILDSLNQSNNNNNNNNTPTSPNINNNSNSQFNSNQIQLLSSIHKRFKIYPKSNNQFLMIFYFEFEYSQFQIYRGNLENVITLEQDKLSFLKSEGLIDFNIHNGYLYSVWNEIKNQSLKVDKQGDGDGDEDTFDQDSEFINQQERELSFKHIYIGGSGSGNGNSNSGGDDENKEYNDENNQFENSKMINSFDKYYESSIEHQDENDQSFYSNKLFNSGLFSMFAIKSALDEYRKLKDIEFLENINNNNDNDDEMNDNDSDSSNSNNNNMSIESLESLVSNTINQEDLKYQSNDQWSIFYKLCTTHQKELSLVGSGLFIESNSSIIFLIRSNQLSIMKPMTLLECLYSNENNILESDKQFKDIVFNCLFNSSSIGSSGLVEVNDLLYLLKCCNYINQNIKDDYRLFEYDLSHNRISIAVLRESERLINGSNSSHNSSSSSSSHINSNNSFTIELIKLFKYIKDPIKIINLLLNQFNNEFNNQNDMIIKLQHSNSDRLWNGSLLSDTLVNSFIASIEIKYRLLSNLSLLLGLISNLRTQLDIDLSLIFESEKSIFQQILKLLSTFYLISWFTKQQQQSQQQNTEIDKITIHNNRQQQFNSNNSNNNNNNQRNLNILTILINSHLNQFTASSRSCKYFDNIEKQISKLLCILAPHMDIFSMGCYLVEKSQYKQLNELLNILNNNNELYNGNSFSPFYYLMGICNAHFSRFNESYKNLIKATESIENFNQDMIKICSLSKEELVCNLFIDVPIIKVVDGYYPKETLIANYYQKCIKIFETRNQPEFIIQFSLFAIEHLAREEHQFSKFDFKNKLEILYSLVFKYSLKINSYELAFQASTHNPNQNVAIENKKRLILSLCENGDIKSLCKLPFSQKDIEDNLLKLASAQELNKKPDYHTILYAYYISRCNYRNAAMTYYERSIRINIEGLGKSRGKSIFDQQQLLDTKLELLSTTINTLKLLDDSNQWFEINSNLLDIRSSSSSGSNKFGLSNNNNNNNNEEFKDISIITLKEIEKEYSYYLASKQLFLIDNQINSDFILSPQQLLEVLIQYSIYDTAFSLAIKQGIDLGAIFESFAIKCVQFQMDPNSNPFFIKAYGDYGFDWSKYQSLNADKVQVAWKVLESYLERYDSDKDLKCLSPSEINRYCQEPSTKLLSDSNQQKTLYMYGEIKLNSLVVDGGNGSGNQFMSTFQVCDQEYFIDVYYDRRVPPFFPSNSSSSSSGDEQPLSINQQVVVVGKIQNGRFIADKVLCKQGQLRYHELVADAILYEGCLDLPQWLVQWFLNGRQDTLFKLYFNHSRLLDAFNCLKSLFNQSLYQLSSSSSSSSSTTVQQQQPISFNIPYDLIDRYFIESKKLLKSINDDKERQLIDDSLKQLKILIENYFKKL